MRNATQFTRAFVGAALMTATLAFPAMTLAQGGVADPWASGGGQPSSEIIDPWEGEGTQPKKASGFLQSVSGGAKSAGDEAGFGESKPLPELVGGIIKSAISLAGIVLIVLVFYGGFIWMTAQGSDDKIKKAKGIITSATIGLAIVFAGYAITNAVIRALSTAYSV